MKSSKKSWATNEVCCCCCITITILRQWGLRHQTKLFLEMNEKIFKDTLYVKLCLKFNCPHYIRLIFSIAITNLITVYYYINTVYVNTRYYFLFVDIVEVHNTLSFILMTILLWVFVNSCKNISWFNSAW